MIRVIDTVNNEVRLEGDDSGWGYHIRQLAAPPVGAKRMDFVFRHWLDGFTADALYTNRGWNHTNCFGLSFTSNVPKYPSGTASGYLPTNFLGFCSDGHSNYPSDPEAAVGIDISGGYGLPGSYNGTGAQTINFLDGLGASIAARTSVNFTTPADNLALPANPTDGATFTGMWRIYASSINKTMYAKFCTNRASLAGDNMFGAIDASYAGVWTKVLHGDVPSVYRPDFDTVVFPSYLMIRFSFPEQSWVFKEARIRYYNYDDELLGSETLP